MTKHKIYEEIYGSQIEEGELDDLVHELASRQASSINNNGVKSQLDFMIEQIGPINTLRELEELQSRREGGGPIMDGTQGGSAMTGREHP